MKRSVQPMQLGYLTALGVAAAALMALVPGTGLAGTPLAVLPEPGGQRPG